MLSVSLKDCDFDMRWELFLFLIRHFIMFNVELVAVDDLSFLDTWLIKQLSYSLSIGFPKYSGFLHL